MKLGESKTTKNGGTWTMTPGRYVAMRAAADKRRDVRFKPLKCHPHAHPLVREFIDILNRGQTTMTSIARRSGFGRDVLHKWRTRSTPSLGAFVAVLNAAGYELRIVKRRGE